MKKFESMGGNEIMLDLASDRRTVASLGPNASGDPLYVNVIHDWLASEHVADLISDSSVVMVDIASGHSPFFGRALWPEAISTTFGSSCTISIHPSPWNAETARDFIRRFADRFHPSNHLAFTSPFLRVQYEPIDFFVHSMSIMGGGDLIIYGRNRDHA